MNLNITKLKKIKKKFHWDTYPISLDQPSLLTKSLIKYEINDLLSKRAEKLPM